MLEITIARYLKTLTGNLLKYVVNSYKYIMDPEATRKSKQF